eukprot:256096-Chlamydomonas_euryale.AAC.1
MSTLSARAAKGPRRQPRVHLHVRLAADDYGRRHPHAQQRVHPRAADDDDATQRVAVDRVRAGK